MPKWFLFCLLAVLFWGSWAVIPKKLGSMTASEQQAASTLGIVPVLLVLVFSKRLLRGERKLRGGTIAFAAGVLSGLGNLAYYAAIGEGGSKASVLAPLTALYPVVVVVLAMIFLGERPSWLQLAGIALALASIYLFNPLKSPDDLFHFAGGAPAFAAIGLWAVSATLQKVASNGISSELATICFLGAFIPLGGFLIATRPMEWHLPLSTWGWVTLLGLTFGVGNLLYLAAFEAGAKAAIAAPLTGLYSLVAVLLAVFFFDETIRWREDAAIGLALLAVVGLSQERKPERKESTT